MTTATIEKKTNEAKLEDLTLTSDPGYAAAAARLVEVQGELNTVQAEIDEIVSRSAQKVSERTTVEVAAAELLEGDRTRLDNPDTRDMNPRLDELSRRRRILNTAIEMQRERIKSEAWRASEAICERIAPEYRERVARLATAIIEVGHAQSAYQFLVDKLRDGDVSWSGSLAPALFGIVGYGPDPNSAISIWLKEAVQNGFIREDAIPSHWRMRWDNDHVER